MLATTLSTVTIFMLVAAAAIVIFGIIMAARGPSWHLGFVLIVVGVILAIVAWRTNGSGTNKALMDQVLVRMGRSSD